MLDIMTSHGALDAVASGLLDGLPGIGFSATLLVLLIALVVALGQPLYVVLGTTTAYLLLTLPDADGKTFARALNSMVEQTRLLSDKVELLAIPLFVIAGALMTNGDIARRLVNVARAAFGWLPGGLAVSAVAACMFFAAISGSSPVTVIAIGTMMFPVLQQEGYSDKFATGVLSSAGSLGILIPPSIPMLVFAIVVAQQPQGWAVPMGPDGQPAYGILQASGLDSVGALFLAGVGPGLLIGGALAAYGIWEGKRRGVKTDPFSWAALWVAVKDGFWALMLPLLILGGIYTGTFSVTRAAAVAVLYSFIVEVYIHNGLKLKDLPRVLSESAVLMGVLLIIIAMALGFNAYLVRAGIPTAAVDLILQWDMDRLTFLLVLNVLLLVVGCLMDIMSAILILVPLLSPIALELGIHPIHLGIIFIVNLEIGYLTPPLGLNLFVASTIFKKSIGEVVAAVMPFTLILLGCLMLVTYVPAISLGPLALLAGKAPPSGFAETISTKEMKKRSAVPKGTEKATGQVTEDAFSDAVELGSTTREISSDATAALMYLEDKVTAEELALVVNQADVLSKEEFTAFVEAFFLLDDDEITQVIEVLPTLTPEQLKARIANDELLEE